MSVNDRSQSSTTSEKTCRLLKFAPLWGLSKPANTGFKDGRAEMCV